MRIIIVLIFFLVSSCAYERVDLNGSWLIVKMTYKNQLVYSSHLTSEARFTVQGYEDMAEINFATKDSVVMVPGVSSEKMLLKFEVIGDSIVFLFSADVLDNNKTEFLDRIEDTSFKEFSVNAEDWNAMKDSVQSVRNRIIKEKGSGSSQYKVSKSIYCQRYKISQKKSKGLLLLESEQTIILMVKQSYLINKEVDKLFEGL